MKGSEIGCRSSSSPAANAHQEMAVRLQDAVHTAPVFQIVYDQLHALQRLQDADLASPPASQQQQPGQQRQVDHNRTPNGLKDLCNPWERSSCDFQPLPAPGQAVNCSSGLLPSQGAQPPGNAHPRPSHDGPIIPFSDYAARHILGVEQPAPRQQVQPSPAAGAAPLPPPPPPAAGSSSRTPQPCLTPHPDPFSGLSGADCRSTRVYNVLKCIAGNYLKAEREALVKCIINSHIEEVRCVQPGDRHNEWYWFICTRFIPLHPPCRACTEVFNGPWNDSMCEAGCCSALTAPLHVPMIAPHLKGLFGKFPNIAAKLLLSSH